MTSTTVAQRPAAETRPTRAPLPEVLTSPPGPAASNAVISPDGHYRYTLPRRWGSGSRVLFVGLTPSTADAAIDDPSTRRMIGFARSAGGGRLTLVNLYAWRSTSPSVLRHVADPIGPDNDTWIAQAVAEADLVIAAWGTHAEPERAAAILLLLAHTTVWSLGRTRDGHPRHPLYVSAKTRLEVHQDPAHDWCDWETVADSGLPERLVARFCPTCVVDEIAGDPAMPGGRWS